MTAFKKHSRQVLSGGKRRASAVFNADEPPRG
jgi:hypothetical protein